MKKQILEMCWLNNYRTLITYLQSVVSVFLFLPIWINTSLKRGTLLFFFGCISSLSAFGQQYDITVSQSVDNPTPTIGSTVTLSLIHI